MSLLATTVSIVLTFGTTAIIDRKKQKAEKREMVLMVMYDMQETLKECEQCQKNWDTFCDLQVDMVAHPEKFYASVTDLLVNVPVLHYTTTTENIFSAPSATFSLSSPSPLSMSIGTSTKMMWWISICWREIGPSRIMGACRNSMLLTTHTWAGCTITS